MLDLNPETVRFIIDKAHEFQGGELTDAQDSDGWRDPAVLELRATIEDLEPDQQISLVSLMWLGRGDYSLNEWETALAEARASWNERTADYLIGTPLLADYLSEGLDQIGQSED